MMIEFENVIEIARPVEVVFAFLSDLENLPKWNYFVIRVRKTSSGAPMVGARFLQERKTDSQELTIVELEKDRLLTVETIPPSMPQLRRSMTFDGFDANTRIVDRWELETGQAQFIQVLARSKVKSAVGENLGKLKELLETGRVALQDGRVARL